MDLNKMKKAELIEYVGELSSTLNQRVSLIEKFKKYDQERNKRFDELTIKLANVIAHRNQLEQSQYKLERKMSETKAEITKVTNQNITLSDQLNELLMEVNSDIDSDSIVNDPTLRKQLLKPVNQCVRLREELSKYQNLAKDGCAAKYIEDLQLELKVTRQKLNEANRKVNQLQAVINADEGKTNIENLIHSHDDMYKKCIKTLENKNKDLETRIKKYEQADN